LKNAAGESVSKIVLEPILQSSAPSALGQVLNATLKLGQRDDG